MATQSIIEFGRSFADDFHTPILEVGSKQQPGYAQCSPREIHAAMGRPLDWTGIDIDPGDGVDQVLDLSQPGGVEALGKERFRTVHCHCVLAHVQDIFAMARGIQEVLQTGGWLFVSVPFAWRIHRIPVDLWRFTPQGMDYLFPFIAFKTERCAFSTRRPGEFLPIDQWPELSLGTRLSERSWPMRTSIRVLRRFQFDGGFFQQRALLCESILMMSGQKGTEKSYSFLNSKMLPASVVPNGL